MKAEENIAATLNALLATVKIIKNGYMFKSPPLNQLKSKKDWRRRYFTLLDLHEGDTKSYRTIQQACQKTCTDGGGSKDTGDDVDGGNAIRYCLVYWKTSNIQNAKPIRTIALTKETTTSDTMEDQQNYLPYMFILSTLSRKFYFACDTQQDQSCWLDAIKNVLISPVYQTLDEIRSSSLTHKDETKDTHTRDNDPMTNTKDIYSNDVKVKMNDTIEEEKEEEEDPYITMHADNLSNETHVKVPDVQSTKDNQCSLSKQQSLYAKINEYNVNRRHTHDAVFPPRSSPPPLPPRSASKLGRPPPPPPDFNISDSDSVFTEEDMNNNTYATISLVQQLLLENKSSKENECCSGNNDIVESERGDDFYESMNQCLKAMDVHFLDDTYYLKTVEGRRPTGVMSVNKRRYSDVPTMSLQHCELDNDVDGESSSNNEIDNINTDENKTVLHNDTNYNNNSKSLMNIHRHARRRSTSVIRSTRTIDDDENNKTHDDGTSKTNKTSEDILQDVKDSISYRLLEKTNNNKEKYIYNVCYGPETY